MDLPCRGLAGIPMRHDTGHIVDLCDVAIVAWNFAVPNADFVIFGGRLHGGVCVFS